MKKKINLFICFYSVMTLLVSCKKDEKKVLYEGGTEPVLTASNTAEMVLDTTDAANQKAILFSWTNPDYRFNTGVSSQDVTYVMEIDTTGANFTNPNKQEIAISNDLKLNPTVKEFNGYINKMGLRYDMPHNLEFRVKAALSGGSAVPLYSNVIKITVTPYLDVVVPIPTNGSLWALGNAFASGWDNPMKDPYTASQKFTQISETLYELTVNFVGGGNFKLIQDQGNWDTQYRPKYSADVPFDGGDFEKKNADPGWNGPAAAGTYKITVNFITGKYKIEKQ